MIEFPVALVDSDTVICVFRGPDPFSGPDDVQHPASVWSIWTEADWAEKCPGWRLVPVVEEMTADRRLFIVGNPVASFTGENVTISYSATPRPENEIAGIIAATRAAALTRIDTLAETARGRYLTPGSGQAMVYGQKVAEARDHQAGGVGPWPHLEAEAGITAASIADVAALILATEGGWIAISAEIEKARLTAKKAISTAATLGAIATAETAAIDAFSFLTA